MKPDWCGKQLGRWHVALTRYKAAQNESVTFNHGVEGSSPSALTIQLTAAQGFS
jgi:hypothetical protein